MSGARFRHLQAFLAVAELGTTQRAASAIGLSQPAITHLIADLEQYLECALFQRHARGMRPTDVGRELLPFVQRTLASLHGGLESVAFRTMSQGGLVRVGAIHGAISGLLVRALPAFGRSMPEVMVELQEATAAQTTALIANRAIDLMLCREPVVWPAGWEFSELLGDRLAIVCGPRHPWAAKRSLPFARLHREMWLLLPPTTTASRIFDELAAQHGFTPRYVKISATAAPGMMVAQLQAERVVALVPYSAVRQQVELGLLSTLDVTDLPPFPPIGILRQREGVGAAALALQEFLRGFVRQHP